MKKIFILFAVLLAACAAQKTKSDLREEYINDHYSDVIKLMKNLEPKEDGAKPSIDEMIVKATYVNGLEQLGLIDKDKPNEVAMDDYLATMGAEKEKRIKATRSSTKTYEHADQDIHELIVYCAVFNTERGTPELLDYDQTIEFNKDHPMLKAYMAYEDTVCACAVAKWAPKFTPQQIKDYVTYVKNGGMLAAKYVAYGKMKSVNNINMVLYPAVTAFRALDNDKERYFDANVVGYFIQNDKECYDEVALSINN